MQQRRRLRYFCKITGPPDRTGSPSNFTANFSNGGERHDEEATRVTESTQLRNRFRILQGEQRRRGKSLIELKLSGLESIVETDAEIPSRAVILSRIAGVNNARLFSGRDLCIQEITEHTASCTRVNVGSKKRAARTDPNEQITRNGELRNVTLAPPARSLTRSSYFAHAT